MANTITKIELDNNGKLHITYIGIDYYDIMGIVSRKIEDQQTLIIDRSHFKFNTGIK